jgi:hypothetical protein
VNDIAGCVVPHIVTQDTLTVPPPVLLLVTMSCTATVWVLPFELKVSVPLYVPFASDVGLTETLRFTGVVAAVGLTVSHVWFEVTVNVLDTLDDTEST